MNLHKRSNPGEYTPHERMMRVLRHEKTDRLPISPIGLTPYTWQVDHPAYRQILDVAEKHCEFMPKYGITGSLTRMDLWDVSRDVEEAADGRKTEYTVLRTSKGGLTRTRVHDPAVGSWSMAKDFVQNEEDLEKRESLPYEPPEPDISGLEEFTEKVGEGGVVYCTGIHNALINATWGMSEELRPIFCFTQPERLRQLVETAQDRLLEYLERLLDRGAGPAFRMYAIENFVEPMMPPSFVDEFIVPYDREIVKLIHDKGCYVVMHCHGYLNAQIERMVKIGVDGVDCAECPPQNDIDLAGMIEKAEGRMFIWGYIQFEDLARSTGDEIEEMVRRAVEMGGTEGRYVLSQAASPWTHDISERTRENWIRMIEAGVKYGGH